MFKKIAGIAVIATLVILLVVNIMEKHNNATSNEYDVSGDTNTEGVALMTPDQLGLKVGEVAPDFELETLDGEKMKLSDLRGKKVILNFWATWCPPCRVEMPEMQQFYEEHQPEVEIVAVNLTSTEAKESDVHRFIEKYNYTYPVLLDKDSTVGNKYVAIVVPTTYFIDRDGVIQHPRKAGPMTYEFMEEMIQSIP